jgi:hypothetical protein
MSLVLGSVRHGLLFHEVDFFNQLEKGTMTGLGLAENFLQMYSCFLT